MRKTTIVAVPLAGLVGALSIGLLGLQNPATADDAAKRDEDTPDLVLVADDDDDDTNARDLSRSNVTNTNNTGVSRSTRDNTNSRFTKVSRDRDLSRSDLTRDWTRDGGDLTRDRSANLTNDRSRNDTRR